MNVGSTLAADPVLHTILKINIFYHLKRTIIGSATKNIPFYILTTKCDLFLKSHSPDQTVNVGEVGKVGNVGKAGKVEKDQNSSNISK